jgi:peptide-methionine (R)-S-oxide reductase
VRRGEFLGSLLGLVSLTQGGCADPAASTAPFAEPSGDVDSAKLLKSPAEWRALLSPASFAVLFERWTEPPGSSPLLDEHRAGTYLCAACFVPLFHSAARYDSGTGWPTFAAAIEDRLEFEPDFALSVARVEYHCRRCGGHQGHVFDDGPPPTGERYCSNGLALRFVPAGEALPQPRS